MYNSYIKDSINCDASYLHKSDIMEWQIKDTLTGQLLYNNKMQGGTSVIAEFFAIVDAMNYLCLNNVNIPIYSDCLVAMKWVKNKKCGTWREDLSEEVEQLIAEYEVLLEEYDDKYEVIKWKTRMWGEIPSDFNRK